jgi:hypothetical protein
VTAPEDEQVKVDIWNWWDADLQPAQLRQAERERRRTYRAVFHVATGRAVQLADQG